VTIPFDAGPAGLAQRFEEQRPRLRGVAYRMLGSLSEADDAVQDAWIRASRADTTVVDNPAGWLTTIVARVCLNRLRTRRRRPEESLEAQIPDAIVRAEGSTGPEDAALLGDAVGLALMIVLETLSPAERLAFVLHDLFDLPFAEIARIVDRTPVATRQLASRARRRIRGATPSSPQLDVGRQRLVVDAFFRAAQAGEFEALVSVLDPEVVLRSDFGDRRPADSGIVRGLEAVARRARGLPNAVIHPVLVNGTAGAFITLGGRPFALMAFTVAADRIVAIDAIADPGRLDELTAGLGLG
jgi:RNA polymerase sigma-70 factor (ECF subfamily)